MQGSREEGYADPAMAAQDAMVKRTSSQHKCKEPLLNGSGGCAATSCMCDVSGPVGSLSAENGGTQNHATNDPVQQELPAAVAG